MMFGLTFGGGEVIIEDINNHIVDIFFAVALRTVLMAQPFGSLLLAATPAKRGYAALTAYSLGHFRGVAHLEFIELIACLSSSG